MPKKKEVERFDVFHIDSEKQFKDFALEIFRYQAENCMVYREFLNHLKIEIQKIDELEKIPFLPIEFFKSHDVLSSKGKVEQIFLSSGTTGGDQSRHLVTDLSRYRESFTRGFERFYDKIEGYVVLGLLPNYLERSGSSLVYMVQHLIERSPFTESGFYLHNLKELSNSLEDLDRGEKKILLIGVTYALLDLAEIKNLNLKNVVVMETGGMKGRRKEMVRKEVHDILRRGFGVKEIHSEYGMTELLSQAYSKGHGIFETPPWMKVFIRDTEDPLSLVANGKTGGVNIIDLANVESCSFIATQDLGRKTDDNKFEILGRFDHSDIRGCNLMIV